MLLTEREKMILFYLHRRYPEWKTAKDVSSFVNPVGRADDAGKDLNRLSTLGLLHFKELTGGMATNFYQLNEEMFAGVRHLIYTQ